MKTLRSRLAAVPVVCISAFCISKAGAAAPVALDLDWLAPAGCPDRNAVRQYVEEVLADSEVGTAALKAHGGVSREAADRWVGGLTMRDGEGVESTRAFEGPTCESVSRAFALVMALTLQPNRTPVAPMIKPPERDAVVPERPPVGRFARPDLGLTGAVDAGSLPSTTYGASLAIGWSPFGSIRWEAIAAYFAKRTATAAGQTAFGADVSAASIGLRGCVAVLDAIVVVAPCAGLGLEWLGASGFGARVPSNGSAWIGSVQPGAVLLWNFNEFVSARMDALAVVPLARPEVAIHGVGEVFRPSALALRFGAGVELHF